MKWSLPKHVFSILPSHPGAHIKLCLGKVCAGNRGEGECKKKKKKGFYCPRVLFATSRSTAVGKKKGSETHILRHC